MITQFFLKGRLTQKARMLTAVAGVVLIIAIFLPLWQMTMISNQYPEGLRLWIYSYRLEGDLQEINTLNRYIGMHPLDEQYFPELRILPLSFALGGALCLLAAALGRRLITTLVLLGGLVSGLGTMGILLYRLYNYGHNLDPRAPIEIDPFTPPPVGINQLANFQVTTFFHLGTACFVLALIALVVALWISRAQVAHRESQAVGSEIAA